MKSNPQPATAGDLKYWVMDQPVLVTADMGLAFYGMHTLGLHPRVLVGSEQLYGGIEQNFFVPFTSKSKERMKEGRVDPPLSTSSSPRLSP